MGYEEMVAQEALDAADLATGFDAPMNGTSLLYMLVMLIIVTW
jgi:hypothetical protein